MRGFIRATAFLVPLACGAAPTASAQDRPDAGPTIEARVQTFKRTGGVSITAWGNTVSVPGTPATFFLTAGSANPPEMTVCGGGFGESGTVADKLSRNSFVWELKLLPVKNENGSSTFNLEWARYQADGGGRPAAEGKSTLTLREGERQTIDLVRGAEGSRCTDESAIVDVAVRFMRANVGERASGGMVTYAGMRRTTGRADPSARLWVYGRGGQPCRRCGTPISRKKQGPYARSTYWCERCQPVPQVP